MSLRIFHMLLRKAALIVLIRYQILNWSLLEVDIWNKHTKVRHYSSPLSQRAFPEPCSVKASSASSNLSLAEGEITFKSAVFWFVQWNSSRWNGKP